jgi:hypothetical protein
MALHVVVVEDFMSFEDVVRNAAGITAIVGVITIIVKYLEYSKQNLLSRYENYSQLSNDWSDSKDVQAIISLLGRVLINVSLRGVKRKSHARSSATADDPHRLAQSIMAQVAGLA